jgi:hypothetical protein
MYLFQGDNERNVQVGACFSITIDHNHPCTLCTKYDLKFKNFFHGDVENFVVMSDECDVTRHCTSVINSSLI